MVFMAMGAEEEYVWRRQTRHSLIGISAAVFH